MLSRKDIDKLAELSRLALDNEEKEKLLVEVQAILGYVGEIQNVSEHVTKKEVSEVHNVFREDRNPHLSGEFSEDLLAEAPRRQDNFIKVKKIL